MPAQFDHTGEFAAIVADPADRINGRGRKDGDGRFYMSCQGFSWEYRTFGKSKHVILAAIRDSGMDTLPADVEF